MPVGECKTCGHTPVAMDARYCPKCGERDPNPNMFWGNVILGAIGVALGFILLFWILGKIEAFFSSLF